MEDSEKTTDSMLLEEAMAETEKSSQETSGGVAEETETSTHDVADLVEGGLDNEDIEMADGVTEDSENNNLAPEDSMDAPAALLEGEDGSEEISQGTLSNSDGFLEGQFISQTDNLIVQNEPPMQLMEEAEGEGDTAEEAEGEDGATVAEADTTDEPTEALGKDETSQELAEEALLLQEGEGDAQEAHDEAGTVDLGSLPEGITLGEMSDHLEDEAAADLSDDVLHGTESEAADDQGETTDEAMEVPPEEGEGENGAEGIAILAGGDQLTEQALNELQGKIAAAVEGGSVQLLAGQENLQGMQLMEGDDKPEEADAALAGESAHQDIQAELNAALLKQEEMKTEDADEPESGAFPEGQQTAVSDALATLASAALDHQTPTNGVKNEVDESKVKAETDGSEPQWMDVGICKGTHCQVRSYYIPRPGQGWDQNWEGITTSTLPDHRALAKLELESGKAYKFRVAAINSCGRGPWSEVAAFKTSLPGYPGAPSAIKIAKTPDGAHLSWEPPPIASGVIEDYHVYLAVRSATTSDSSQVVSNSTKLAFVRIYQGAANQCTVGNDTLNKAHIDMTTKPAILFRISARNEKGIGPATQVRWLQEVGAPNTAAAAATARPTYAPRRPAADTKPPGNYKRKKSE